MTDHPPVIPPSLVSAGRYALTACVTYWLARRGVDGLTVANVGAGVMQLLITVSWALERWHPSCNLRTWWRWVRERLT